MGVWWCVVECVVVCVVACHRLARLQPVDECMEPTSEENEDDHVLLHPKPVRKPTSFQGSWSESHVAEGASSFVRGVCRRGGFPKDTQEANRWEAAAQ